MWAGWTGDGQTDRQTLREKNFRFMTCYRGDRYRVAASVRRKRMAQGIINIRSENTLMAKQNGTAE